MTGQRPPRQPDLLSKINMDKSAIRMTAVDPMSGITFTAIVGDRNAWTRVFTVESADGLLWTGGDVEDAVVRSTPMKLIQKPHPGRTPRRELSGGFSATIRAWLRANAGMTLAAAGEPSRMQLFREAHRHADAAAETRPNDRARP